MNAANHDADRPPVVPDYELRRRIGQGAYGDVWLARGLTGTWRAVKIVWRDRFADASPYEREFRGVKEAMGFSLEAGQLPLLHVGRGEDDRYFYYVMELADDASDSRPFDPDRYVSLTLKEVKARAGRLSPAQCFEFAEKIARALAALHARGLVHRDIKPSNIVLVKGEPRLADIGLVAAADDARTYVGTQGYLPPEGPGAAAADVFALGRLLYELATGFDRGQFPRLPADLTDRAERKALFQFNEILLRACDPQAPQRYRDATVLLADIRARRAALIRRSPGRAWLVAAAVVLLAAGAVWWHSTSAPALAPVAPVPPATPTAAPAANEKSIAVLPFTNLSDDRENGYFADGVSEDILTSLANLSSLRVIARTTMLQYRQTTKPMRQIGAELAVAYVLEGSVRRAGNKVRVSGQLIRTDTEQSVWARNYDRDLTDVFAIQSELARDIATALQGVLTARDEARLARRATSNVLAYDLYRQARAIEQSFGSETKVKERYALLQRAVQLDPTYAEAWAHLGSARLDATGEPFERADPALVQQAEDDLRRAEQLAPENYEVMLVRSSFAAAKGDRATVDRIRQRIMELYPNGSEGWYAVALTADHDHRYDDAAAAYRQALANDPRNASILGNFLFMLVPLRRYDEVGQVLRQLRAVQPDELALQFMEARLAFHQRGSTAELRALLARLPPGVDPKNDELVMTKAQALFGLGDAAGFVQLWRESGPNWRFHEARVLDEAAVAMALRAIHDPTDVRPLLAKPIEKARASLMRDPRNIRRRSQLGLYLALAGETEEARRELRDVRDRLRAVDPNPNAPTDNRDAWFYNGIWRAWAGEVDEAIPQIAAALNGPSPTQHSFVEELRQSFLTLPFAGRADFAAVLDIPANNAPIFGNGEPALAPIPPEGTKSSP